jgi:hypothetical protein
VRLDFGSEHFNGADRWIEIAVRPAGSGTFTALSPRQRVTSAPYSIKSLNSETALIATNATQLGGVAADQYVITTDPRMSDSRQASGINFATASLTGVVPIVNGGTGSATQNFVDVSTNQLNIAGNKRFVQTTTLDFANVGTLTSNGGATFNGTAIFNGADAVQMNALNVGNGLTADVASVSELNATNGVSGNVVNAQTHFSIGGAPVLQATGEQLLIGRDVGAGAGVVRGTAIGHGTQVLQSDSIVLGTTPGFFLPLPNTRVGIGVFSPTTKLDVGGQVLIRSNVANPPTGGGLRGLLNVVQTGSGDANFYMQGAFGGRGINFATNVLTAGADARLVISHYDGTTYQNRFAISPSGDIGIGTITPAAKLDVAGTVRVGTIGIAGVNAVCLDASLILSACSSSRRYKNDINNFTTGLDLIRRLRPVSFKWTANSTQDLGLVAEEVAELEPLLATYNENDEVEGVKYDRVGVVAINAINQQQAQIEHQRKQIERQQQQINQLRSLVCDMKPEAPLCKKEKK